MSDRCDHFVLKGAMLLRLWSDRPYRATRDLDLLHRGNGAFDAVLDDIRAIVAAPAPPDAVEFDVERIHIEEIRAEDEYAGARVTLPTRCGKARLSLQIDMGLADVVWPAPLPCAYPALLDFPAPQLLAYPRAAVVAEKLEAMVVLGDRNSRIKDFFDLQYLANHFEFDRATLAETVRRTFERRNTPIPEQKPFALTREYWDNPSRPVQVRANTRRIPFAGAGGPRGRSDAGRYVEPRRAVAGDVTAGTIELAPGWKMPIFEYTATMRGAAQWEP